MELPTTYNELFEYCKRHQDDKKAFDKLLNMLPRDARRYIKTGSIEPRPRAKKSDLLTKEIERKLEKTPLYSQDGKGLDAKLIVKYFYPAGSGTWLITEGEKQQNGDWLLFGLAKIHEWEWGYTLLSDLEKYRGTVSFTGGGFNGERYTGIKIERDLYARGTVRENLTSQELKELEYCHII